MSSNFKASQSITGDVDGTGMRIAVVCGRFNDLITNRMLEGTLGGLGVHGVKESDVIVAWVPGPSLMGNAGGVVSRKPAGTVMEETVRPRLPRLRRVKVLLTGAPSGVLP